MNSLYYWIYHAQKQKETLSEDLLDSYNGWMEKFNNWKERNIDTINLPKKEGDNIHESFLMQLDWLNEIGFQGNRYILQVFSVEYDRWEESLSKFL